MLSANRVVFFFVSKIFQFHPTRSVLTPIFFIEISFVSPPPPRSAPTSWRSSPSTTATRPSGSRSTFPSTRRPTRSGAAISPTSASSAPSSSSTPNFSPPTSSPLFPKLLTVPSSLALSIPVVASTRFAFLSQISLPLPFIKLHYLQGSHLCQNHLSNHPISINIHTQAIAFYKSSALSQTIYICL